MLTLESLVRHLKIYKRCGDGNPTIKSIEMDSRAVVQQSLFVCLKGYTVDGHEFAEEAIRKGAVAIVAERPLQVSVPVVVVRDTKRALAILSSYFYNHPTRDLHLYGITGTNGKTTTAHLVEAILRKNQCKTGMIGTLYTKINDQTFETKNTTPESLMLQKSFYDMVNQGVDSCVMEVSSHALHLGRVRGCDFDVAVFTNLTKDHLDYHKTMGEYKQAKGLLFSQLGNHYDHSGKTAVLNADDPVSHYFETICATPVLTYGIQNEADVRATNVSLTPAGTTFDLESPWGTISLSLKLMGMFSVYNALAAASACLVKGIPLSTIKEALVEVPGIPGRFEPVDAGQNFAVIVDYAHTPDSLKNILVTAKEMVSHRLWVVVGCGGDRDKTKRPEMARIAASHSDHTIFTSDNPRSEDSADILADMEQGVDPSHSYVAIENRKEAIRYAVSKAQKGDMVVIAGKGHETYQVIGSKVMDFDDRKVAREAILDLK